MHIPVLPEWEDSPKRGLCFELENWRNSTYRYSRIIFSLSRLDWLIRACSFSEGEGQEDVCFVPSPLIEGKFVSSRKSIWQHWDIEKNVYRNLHTFVIFKKKYPLLFFVEHKCKMDYWHAWKKTLWNIKIHSLWLLLVLHLCNKLVSITYFVNKYFIINSKIVHFIFIC